MPSPIADIVHGYSYQSASDKYLSFVLHKNKKNASFIFLSEEDSDFKQDKLFRSNISESSFTS